LEPNEVKRIEKMMKMKRRPLKEMVPEWVYIRIMNSPQRRDQWGVDEDGVNIDEK
jgi:hypothetical protein